MRLPFVSRVAYERECEWTHRLSVHLDRLTVMYHELAMRVSVPTQEPKPHGFAPVLDAMNPPTAAAVPTQAVRPVSIIAQTIREESGGDERTARYLWKRAGELRAENKKPEEIAQELRAWQTTEVEAE